MWQLAPHLFLQLYATDVHIFRFLSFLLSELQIVTASQDKGHREKRSPSLSENPFQAKREHVLPCFTSISLLS